MGLVRSSLGTKFVARFGDLVCNLALNVRACRCIPTGLNQVWILTVHAWITE